MAMPSMSPDQWRTAGSVFEWRGQKIFYRLEGRGDFLLLIHGFPTSSWDWAPLWPELVKNYRVVTLDLIGFGFSAKPRDFAYTISAQADLIEDLLAHVGATHYRILAHDYGVTVTQELLARQRDATSIARIGAVCLLNGGLFPETHRPVLMQKLLASPLGPWLVHLMTYRTFVANFRKICARPLHDDDLQGMWRLINEKSGLTVIPKLIGYMAERRRQRERWVGALVNAEVPLRLINGLADPISGAHLVARYRELIRFADVVELADVGHYPQLEAPDAVLRAVLDFFVGGASAPTQA